MSRVAARADGRDGQPLLEQALAVNAVLVSLEDLLFREVVRPLNLRAFRVALCAHPRNVERRNHRLTIREPKDVVFSVAVLTPGGILVPGFHTLPVAAVPVGRDRIVFIVMALTAIDRFKLRPVRVSLDAGQLRVTVHALQSAVNAPAKALLIHV